MGIFSGSDTRRIGVCRLGGEGDDSEMLCLSWTSSSVKDSCTCDLALIITISDTSENQTKRLGSDDHINKS